MMIDQYLKWYIVELPVDLVIKPKTIVDLNEDVIDWLNKNCSNRWSRGKVVSMISCDIWFENKSDAFAYLLRWG